MSCVIIVRNIPNSANPAAAKIKPHITLPGIGKSLSDPPHNEMTNSDSHPKILGARDCIR